jgi:hypothetical protein
MGHKVNPETFRIGASVDLKYQLRDPLLANLMIYKTIKSLSLRYAAPYVMRPNDPNVDPEVYEAMQQKYQITTNPFLGNSLIFSHLNISYSPTLHIAIFMMDSKAEIERTRRNRPERSLYYLSSKFFYRSSRFYRYFLKSIYRFQMSKKKQVALRWYHSDKYYAQLLPSFDLTFLLANHRPQIKDTVSPRDPVNFVLANRVPFYFWFSNIFLIFAKSASRIHSRAIRNAKLLRKVLHKLNHRERIKNPGERRSVFWSRYIKYQDALAYPEKYSPSFVMDAQIKQKKWNIRPLRFRPSLKMRFESIRMNVIKNPQMFKESLDILAVEAVYKRIIRVLKHTNRLLKILRPKVVQLEFAIKLVHNITHYRYSNRVNMAIRAKSYAIPFRISSLWLANNINIFSKRSRTTNYKKHLSILRFLLRYTPLFDTTSIKKRIFIVHILLRSLMTFLLVIRSPAFNNAKHRIARYRKYINFGNLMSTVRKYSQYLPKNIRLRAQAAYAVIVKKCWAHYIRKKRQKRIRRRPVLLLRPRLKSILSIPKRTRRAFRRISGVTQLKVRIALWITNLFLYLTQFRYRYLQFNKPIIQTRHRLFQLYGKIILFTLFKACFIRRDHLIITRFYGLYNRNICAQFLVNYIIVKLSQYFTIHPVINPIIRRLERLEYIDGFRFIISGRLTRRQRAAYIVRAHSAMPLAKHDALVDYAFDYKIMKFGVVGIKVLLLISKSRPPAYYFFEYRDKL